MSALPTEDLDSYPRKIGRAIRFLRQRRGWTQEFLSRKARLSVNTVTEIESGRPCFVLTCATLLTAMGFDWADMTKAIQQGEHDSRM